MADKLIKRMERNDIHTRLIVHADALIDKYIVIRVYAEQHAAILTDYACGPLRQALGGSGIDAFVDKIE